MQLSEHFSLEELTRSHTANKLHINNTPSDAELKNLQILCQQILEPARKVIGSPLIITSGYRNKQLNKAVGGVANSYHVMGKAADILVNATSNQAKEILGAALCAALNYQPLTDLCLFEHSSLSDWVHVQWSTKPRHIVNLKYNANYKAR